MPTPETPKEIPALDKVSSEDLRAWRDMISTPFLALFLLFLEKTRKRIGEIVLSTDRLTRLANEGRGLEFYQGKAAMISEVQSFFKDVEVELTNRQRCAADKLNANNERTRRQRQPQ